MLRRRTTITTHENEPILGLYTTHVTQKPQNRFFMIAATGLVVILSFLLLFCFSRNSDIGCDNETVIERNNGFYICYDHSFIRKPVVTQQPHTKQIYCDIDDNVTISASAELTVTYEDEQRRSHTSLISRPLHVCTWAWIAEKSKK